MTTEISCLLARIFPYELVFRRPTLKKMRAAPDFDQDAAGFQHNEGKTGIPLVTECMYDCGGNISDELKSDEETEDEEIYGEGAGVESENDLKIVGDELVFVGQRCLGSVLDAWA